MFKNHFIVGTGGFIGSVARYLTQIYAEKTFSHHFPAWNFYRQYTGLFYHRCGFCHCRKWQPDESRMAHLSNRRLLWRVYNVLVVCIQQFFLPERPDIPSIFPEYRVECDRGHSGRLPGSFVGAFHFITKQTWHYKKEKHKS